MQREKRLSYIIQNLILIAIIIVSSLVSNLTYFSEYTPFYEVTIIFFSCAIYPRAISFTSLLIYGILRDILFAYPIGFSALLFLSFKSLIIFYEVRVENWTIYLRFALNLIIALVFQAVILSITFKYNFVDLTYAFIKRWYITSLLYPCFHLCYSAIMKFIDKKYYHVADQS